MSATLLPEQRASARAAADRAAALGAILRAALILIVCFVVLFPVYWMVLNAIQPGEYSLTWPPALIPHGLEWSNFARLFEDKPIVEWLLMSTYVAAIVVVVTLIVVVPAAYALSRLRWRGRNLLGLFLLFTQIMPGAMIVAPELTLFRAFGWTDNLTMLALLHAAFVVPLCTWILKASFDAVPGEIVEAALVDGCNHWQTLFSVVLPLTRPGLVAVSVVAFFFSWNEYLFSSALITRSGLYTGSLGLATLITQLDTPLFVLMAAGVTFSVLPILFYLAIQRHILRGLTAGAVKG
ncbi:carbohydrate ABC transporter permease [Bauldia litoralis]|uniref:carbohydrate ABC transporter permease n=1 Tax=Bauldia litoralis TaxID=665467 RepID=UPI0032644C46